jgi:hypothetical protein
MLQCWGSQIRMIVVCSAGMLIMKWILLSSHCNCAVLGRIVRPELPPAWIVSEHTLVTGGR